MSDSDDTSEFFPARDAPGAVLMIPNRHWGFELVSGEDHPGACAFYRLDSRTGILVGGTDVDFARGANWLLVEPTEENGLHKLTAFRLVPRPVRVHRLRLYFPQRLLGRLSGAVLHNLRQELARLHPEEE